MMNKTVIFEHVKYGEYWVWALTMTNRVALRCGDLRPGLETSISCLQDQVKNISDLTVQVLRTFSVVPSSLDSGAQQLHQGRAHSRLPHKKSF